MGSHHRKDSFQISTMQRLFKALPPHQEGQREAHLPGVPQDSGMVEGAPALGVLEVHVGPVLEQEFTSDQGALRRRPQLSWEPKEGLGPTPWLSTSASCLALWGQKKARLTPRTAWISGVDLPSAALTQLTSAPCASASAMPGRLFWKEAKYSCSPGTSGRASREAEAAASGLSASGRGEEEVVV